MLKITNIEYDYDVKAQGDDKEFISTCGLKCQIAFKNTIFNKLIDEEKFYEYIKAYINRHYNDKVMALFFKEDMKSVLLCVYTKTTLREGDVFDKKIGRAIARSKAKRKVYYILRNVCKHLFSKLQDMSSELVYSGILAEGVIDSEELFLDKHQR